MKPPTKFENMRANRAAAEYRAAPRAKTLLDAFLSQDRTVRVQGDAPIPAPWTPAEPPKQPTMTVDGVEYVEKPSAGCKGCFNEYRDFGYCARFEGAAIALFGGDCAARNVIYLKAS